MIHHLSIPARDPKHVAEVLMRVLGGTVTRFGPHGNSYIAWAGDEVGTAVEVYPAGTELFPPEGHGQAQFRVVPASGFTSTHAAISVDRSEEELHAIARAEGWRSVRLDRGGFEVVEFWVENRVMLELLTPGMARDYLAATAHFRRR